MIESRTAATADLPPVQVGCLRALWFRRAEVAVAGGATPQQIAKWSGFSYQRIWRALTALDSRGYVTRRGRHWWIPDWSAIELGHRAQFTPLLDASTPDEAELVMGGPGFAVRLAEWWFHGHE